MFKRTIREILSYTPFISPDMERFYKNNYKTPNRFNKFPYPFLSLGRVIVSVLVIYIVIIGTLNNTVYKDIVDNQIINKNFVTPTKKALPANNNSNPIQGQLDNITNTIKNEVDFAIESTKVTTTRYLLGEVFYGPLGLILRVLLVYFLYSGLFYLFGNTISQRERKARVNTVNLTKIGQIILDKPQLLLSNSELELLNREFNGYTEKEKLYSKEYQTKVMAKIQKKIDPLG